jgi:hypothetical protein
MCEQSILCSDYDEERHLAERELAAFMHAVTKSYGPEQARLSAEDWVKESELMDSSPRTERRSWRSVTIAASTRLASRAAELTFNRTP